LTYMIYESILTSRDQHPRRTYGTALGQNGVLLCYSVRDSIRKQHQKLWSTLLCLFRSPGGLPASAREGSLPVSRPLDGRASHRHLRRLHRIARHNVFRPLLTHDPCSTCGTGVKSLVISTEKFSLKQHYF
jgi:hypothetical protein